jgi:ABC-type multidrug transport system fused ATPase/permease subunit
MNLEVDYFDKIPTGMMVSRISEDVMTMRETYIDKGAQTVQGACQAISGIVYVLIRSWLVSLVAIGCVPLIILVFVLGEKMIEKIWIEYSAAATANSNKAEETITQFRTVKSFDAEMKEFEDYSRGLDGVDKIFHKTSIAHGTKNGLLQLLSNAMTGGLIYLACYVVLKHPLDITLEMDILVQVFMGSFFVVMGLSNATAYMDDFRKANISAQEILSVLTRKPQVHRLDGKHMKRVIGSIEFKNVSFKYSSRSEYAVKNLSFKVNAGETVAFVGESGCGKTTTLQLIQRFYEIDEGEILLDGIDIKRLSPYNLRSYISAVPQTPVLYSMSVRDNIAFARRDADDEEVIDSAKVGNSHNFISDLPENYKTIVQQTSLSGGQKQRICISRAILANTPILLLDEATAALDTESEQLVQESLEKFRQGKTALVVAHRLATVMRADRIFVFENGTVVESGTHQELLEKNGIYSDLVNFQLQ